MDEPRAPRLVEDRSSQFFERVRELLGDRVAECRHDPDRWLRVTMIDLDHRDAEAIQRVAAETGVDGWIRIEQADPEHLASWERLRRDIIALEEVRPRLMNSWTTPDPGYQRPPVRVDFEAFADGAAAQLHERYGDFVELTVGAFAYPPGSREEEPRRSRAARESLDPAELRVGVEVPLTVVSGHTAHHHVLVTNLGQGTVVIYNNGKIYADIADPHDRRIVGGYVGGMSLPRRRFTARSNDTVQIPLVIGTASLDPALGYAVPSGEWQLVVPLQLGDGRDLEAMFPFTIVAAH